MAPMHIVAHLAVLILAEHRPACARDVAEAILGPAREAPAYAIGGPVATLRRGGRRMLLLDPSAPATDLEPALCDVAARAWLDAIDAPHTLAPALAGVLLHALDAPPSSQIRRAV